MKNELRKWIASIPGIILMVAVVPVIGPGVFAAYIMLMIAGEQNRDDFLVVASSALVFVITSALWWRWIGETFLF